MVLGCDENNEQCALCCACASWASGFHALYREEDDHAECSQHRLRGCDPKDAFPVAIPSSASRTNRLAVGFLNIRQRPVRGFPVPVELLLACACNSFFGCSRDFGHLEEVDPMASLGLSRKHAFRLLLLLGLGAAEVRLMSSSLGSLTS